MSDAKAAVDEGASIDMVCKDGKPLLNLAVRRKHTAICKWLMDNGADIDTPFGARRFSMLHNAVASLDFGFASTLLELGANPSPQASNDATPLHIAARTGQVYLADKLIKSGANLDAVDSKGRTALLWAVEKGDTAMAKLLVKSGCDVNVFDKRSRSPLSIAIANDSHAIHLLLLDRGARVWKPNKAVQLVAEHSENPDRSR